MVPSSCVYGVWMSLRSNVLHRCDLVLNVHSSQSLVELVQDPLTLEAAAPAVQTGHQDVVRADQHRVPAEREAVRHSLTTGGAVTEQGAGHERSTKTQEKPDE